MKKTVLAALALQTAALAFADVNFNDYFTDATMRLDYVLAGNNNSAQIYLDDIICEPGWAGRRTRLDEKFLNGNGQVTVTDPATGQTIYVTTFSTLFQEWQQTEEAANVSRAFEATYLIPWPKKPVDVTITLTDTHHRVSSELKHRVDPQDILIKRFPKSNTPVTVLLESGNPADCVDVVIAAEGYAADEREKFDNDARRAVDAIFSHEPFASLRDRFNVYAVALPSADSGPSVPHDTVWNRTALGSHYDSFYMERYLTTRRIHDLYDHLAGIPCDQVILLVNTPIYGGAGIFNQVTIAASDHPTFKEVLVHEFGHGYGGLADEYYYDDQYEPTYPTDTEPWEPNITTLVDFGSKWEDMLPAGIKIPTEPVDLPNPKEVDRSDLESIRKINEASQRLGVYEGGGYQSKGVYRPVQECRMKVNNVDHFCPVCSRAIVRITDFYTGH